VASDEQKSTILSHAQKVFELKTDEVDLIVDRKATDSPQDLVQEGAALWDRLKTRGKTFLKTLDALRSSHGLETKPPYGRHGVTIVTHAHQSGNVLEKLVDYVTDFIGTVFKRISHKISAKWTTKEPQADGRTLRLETPLRVTPEVITKLADLPDGGQLKLRQFLVTVAPKLAETSNKLAIEVQAKPASEESKSPEAPKKGASS
jgi:hypothetical protein